MQEKGTFLALLFLKKKVLPRILFKFSAKRVICDLGHIFNEVIRGIVQKPDAVGIKNWPGKKLMLS